MSSSRHLIPLALVSALAFAAPMTALTPPAFAQALGVSITVAPPALPIYAQPVIPGDGYIWQPGYWGYGPAGYYWVPGTWVQPPTVDLLWTPGYWGWLGGAFLWHAGYWGPHVGFYGGINYGFGYGGVGYAGGHWDNGHFFYNRTVNNFGGAHITNVYNQPVHNVSASRVSFNGGTGGTHAQPTAAERTAANEHHVDPTPLQMQHQQAASGNHALLATANHGRPPIAATARPAAFTGHGIVSAQAGAAPAAAHHNGPPQHKPQQVSAHPQQVSAHPPQGGPPHPAAAHSTAEHAPPHPDNKGDEHDHP